MQFVDSPGGLVLMFFSPLQCFLDIKWELHFSALSYLASGSESSKFHIIKIKKKKKLSFEYSYTETTHLAWHEIYIFLI